MPTTISGGRELARRVGAPYCLHESNRGRVSFEFEPLADGQRLEAGNVLVDVLHTPGHTLDSICLLVRDLRRGNEPWFVITGDTLFVGAVGRPDLAGREREMAAQLHDTPAPQAAHAAERSGDLSGPPGGQRLWRRSVRQARVDHRLREALQSDALDVAGGLRRSAHRRHSAIACGHGPHHRSQSARVVPEPLPA